MKVTADRQRLLLDLADADATLARLDHRAKNLPEDAEIADLDRRIDEAKDDQVRAEIAAEDLNRDYRRIDSEITGMRDREQKDSLQLNAGGLPPKQLSELQHELAGLGRRRAVLEDDLLGLMERQEAVEAEAQRASALVAHLNEDLAAVRGRREQAAAELAADREVAATRRDSLAAETDADLYQVYEKQRSAGKVGAGLLRARRCGACRMEIDRGTLATIAAAADDEVLRCGECGAILVRTNESGLGR